MYTVYTTPGFIIHSGNYSEADKILQIFTRDFGLIYVSARGIRLEKSKLRPFTQNYTLGFFSVVRGKEFWRLTSAQDYFFSEISKLAKYYNDALVARVALLLKRFLHGEEANESLFQKVESFLKFIGQVKELSDEQMKTLESIVVLQILYALGYIGKDAELDAVITYTAGDFAKLDDLAGLRVKINSHINRALKESQL